MLLRSNRSAATRSVMVVACALLGATLVAVPAQAGKPKCFGRTATIVGTRGGDVLRGTRRGDVIVARGGEDLVRARGGNDLICLGRGQFDIVFAGGGDDRVRGGGGTDAAFPQGGDDLFEGGRGPDFVTYEGTSQPIQADLGSGTVTGQGSDRLSSVESIAGSEGDDHLVGSDGDNELHGYGGNDTLIGGDGFDFLVPGADDDTLDGGPSGDFVLMAIANAGPDLGDDSFTDAGVVLDLAEGTASGPQGVGNDTLGNIEGAAGTLGNDTLRGDDGFNDLVGLEGDDTINVGGPGEADYLGTQDLVFPGAGDDTVTGSSGIDAVDYGFLGIETEPTAGVTVDLQAGTASGTDIGTDSLDSIETAVGSFYDDVLSGSSQANVLIGLDGSDTIQGEAGDDALDGDAFSFFVPFDFEGTDTLDGGAGTDACVGGSDADTGCESADWPPEDGMRRETILGTRLTSFGYAY